MSDPKPLAECREEDLTNHHALVYGRTRVWCKIGDEMQWTWSKVTWWKAMWYPHRGAPSETGAWGVYGQSGATTYSGPGDAQLSHFLPMPAPPEL